MLRRFMRLFPESAMTSAIKGCFMYHGIPLGSSDDSDDKADEIDDKEDEVEEGIDPFDIVLVCHHLFHRMNAVA